MKKIYKHIEYEVFKGYELTKDEIRIVEGI